MDYFNWHPDFSTNDLIAPSILRIGIYGVFRFEEQHSRFYCLEDLTETKGKKASKIGTLVRAFCPGYLERDSVYKGFLIQYSQLQSLFLPAGYIDRNLHNLEVTVGLTNV